MTTTTKEEEEEEEGRIPNTYSLAFLILPNWRIIIGRQQIPRRVNNCHLAWMVR